MQEQEMRAEDTVVENNNTDYIAAIKELKENSVEKAKYDALRLENKKLIDAIVNGQEVNIEESAKDKPTISELRDKLFKNENQTNLEYVTNALNLRNELLAQGFEDPFVPQGSLYNPTQADYEKAERVATVLQEMVDEADGDPNVFLNEYQRRVKDTGSPNKNKR